MNSIPTEKLSPATPAASRRAPGAKGIEREAGDHVEVTEEDDVAEGSDDTRTDDVWGNDRADRGGDRAASADRKPGREGEADRPERRSPLSPLLAGIEVTMSVEIGSHRLPLRELMSVDPGQIFALDRMTHEPVLVLVNGKPFARGEVVAMGERFGIRLLEMIGTGLES